MTNIDKHELFVETEIIRRNGENLVLFVKTPKNKEIIIVPNQDIQEKIKYIDKVYDFNLEHRGAEGVCIIGITDLREWVEVVSETDFKEIGFQSWDWSRN
jgi:hypothetical protein